MVRSGFFEWVAECCSLLGWDKMRGVEMLPDADESWFNCFDDGMTPRQAVDKFVATGQGADRDSKGGGV